VKFKYKGVIFDLDGTLVNTIDDIAASMNKALKARGLPELAAKEYRGKVGWGVERLAYLSLPEDKRSEESAAALAKEASVFYTETPLKYSKVYPGITELISTLSNKKIKTAVLTNKPDPAAQIVVAGLFPPGSFSYVRGEIFGSPRKPDPSCVWDILTELDYSPASVIIVGDSEIDMEMAVSSGCFPLGVSWGYRSVETIKNAGAKRIIDKAEELLDFFI